MKAITLNTHSWMEAEPKEKLAQIVDFLATQEADVIALQEVNQLISAKEIIPDDYFCPQEKQHPIREDNFAYLIVQALRKRGLNYYWSYSYAHVGYDIYEEGLAILSKEEQTPKEVVTSNEEYVKHLTRKILIAQTQSAIVVCGHYSWAGELGFDYEWQKTIAALENAPLPIILMGDFNNPAGSSEHAQILASPLNLQDTFLQAKERYGEFTVVKKIDGWRENNDLLRIDFIFVAKEFHVEQYQVIFDGHRGSVVSDHFGVLAVFE